MRLCLVMVLSHIVSSELKIVWFHPLVIQTKIWISYLKQAASTQKKQVGLIAIVLKLQQFLYIVFRMLLARCMLVSKLTNYRAVWFPCGRTITYFKNGEMILKLDILFLITSTSTCRFGRKANFSLNNFENATIMEMSIRWMLSVEWIILTGQI